MPMLRRVVASAEFWAVAGLALVTWGIAERFSPGAAAIVAGSLIFVFAVWGHRIR